MSRMQSGSIYQKPGFSRVITSATPGVEPTTNNGLAPLNVYNSVIVLGRTTDYHGIAPLRLSLVMGRGVPVAIVAEIDRKFDDGEPAFGSMRLALSAPTTFVGVNNWGASEANCIDLAPPVRVGVALVPF